MLFAEKSVDGSRFFCFFQHLPELSRQKALRKIERHESHSESEVLQMQTETIDKSQQATPQIEEELIDTLIAISVVAKRLAANLRQQNKENGGTENEQNE